MAEPTLLTPEELLRIVTVDDLAIAPDGTHVACSFSAADLDDDRYRSWIEVYKPDGRSVARLGTPAPARALSWAPSGQELAFLAGAELWVLAVAHVATEVLLGACRATGRLAWCPLGARIAFAQADERDRAGAGEPMVIRRDRPSQEARIVVVARDGRLTVVSEGPEDASPSWSADGHRLVFSRTLRDRDGTPAAHLRAVDPGGACSRELHTGLAHAAAPAWSSDGKAIAFVGSSRPGLGGNDPGRGAWLVPAAGGDARELPLPPGAALAHGDGAPDAPAWAADARSVMVRVARRGDVHLVRVPAGGGTASEVIGGNRQVVRESVAPAAGTIAFAASSTEDPVQLHIAREDGSDERPLTRFNGPLVERWPLELAARSFCGPEGDVLHGFVLRSQDAAAGGPLLACCHGGPHHYFGSGFQPGHLYRYVLAARGWTVLMLNSSGSSSYGPELAERIHGRWGVGDLPEHLAAVDQLVAEEAVDPDRVAVAGYSYGGYLAAHAAAEPGRFRAAVVAGAVINPGVLRRYLRHRSLVHACPDGAARVGPGHLPTALGPRARCGDHDPDPHPPWRRRRALSLRAGRGVARSARHHGPRGGRARTVPRCRALVLRPRPAQSAAGLHQPSGEVARTSHDGKGEVTDLESDRIVIVGAGEQAQIAYEYFTHDSPHEVCAFSVESEYLGSDRFEGLPVVPFEELASRYDPSEFKAFVALSSTKLNRVRARLFGAVKSAGFECASYVSSRAFVWRNVEIGENCMIFEHNVLQHNVKIGDDVVLWSGNHVGHRTRIGDHCFVSSHCVISGYCEIGDFSFLGVNCSVADYRKIAPDSVIGAGAVVIRDTEPRGVYVGNPATHKGDAFASFGVDEGTDA